MLSIHSFLTFAKTKKRNAKINNKSWYLCAIGEYFTSEKLTITPCVTANLADILTPKDEKEGEQFSKILSKIKVNTKLLNNKAAYLWRGAKYDTNLYNALNTSKIDTYGQLVDVIEDAPRQCLNK